MRHAAVRAAADIGCMAATFFSAAIGHETNTFAVTPTRLGDFDFGGMPAPAATPEQIRRYFHGTRTVHGGYLAAGDELGFELEPLLWAFATPSGVVERGAYEALAGVLLERLARRRREAGCSGVLLDLHGAMVSEHLEDVEGDLIERTRAVMGAGTPLVVTLDLHANVTARMAAHADAIIGFEEYPHVDAFERGVQAGRLIHAAAAGRVRPRLAFVQLPLITMPPRQCTLISPARARCCAGRRPWSGSGSRRCWTRPSPTAFRLRTSATPAPRCWSPPTARRNLPRSAPASSPAPCGAAAATST